MTTSFKRLVTEIEKAIIQVSVYFHIMNWGLSNYSKQKTGVHSSLPGRQEETGVQAAHSQSMLIEIVRMVYPKR